MKKATQYSKREDEWRACVCHNCGEGDILVWEGMKTEYKVLYDYRCVGCKISGRWQEYVHKYVLRRRKYRD